MPSKTTLGRRDPKKRGTQKDDFSHPYFDALVKRATEDVDNILEDSFGDWTHKELAMLSEKLGKGLTVKKPAVRVLRVDWQHELFTAKLKPRGLGLDLVPVGYSDLSILVEDHTPHVNFDKGPNGPSITTFEKEVWIHLLCRPSLSQASQVIRELKSYRGRQRHPDETRKEEFGVLTLNAEFGRIFEDHGFIYQVYSQSGLR